MCGPILAEIEPTVVPFIPKVVKFKVCTVSSLPPWLRRCTRKRSPIDRVEDSSPLCILQTRDDEEVTEGADDDGIAAAAIAEKLRELASDVAGLSFQPVEFEKVGSGLGPCSEWQKGR